jgi:hypothetical protein
MVLQIVCKAKKYILFISQPSGVLFGILQNVDYV